MAEPVGSSAGPSSVLPDLQSTRLDKWLWHARVTRTRTLARKLVEAGKVRLNRARTTSPAHAVKVGDVLTITLPRAVLVYEIAGMAEHRGPFAQASQLYVDRSPAPAATSAARRSLPETAGRPTPRDRKAARRLSGKPD